MKKIYIILIPVLAIILTGCKKTKTLVCTRDNETTNNVVISSKVNVEYNDDKLLTFKLETINDEFVESLIRSSKETTKKLDGKTGISATYEKNDVGVKYTLTVNYEELKDEEITELDQKLYNKTMKVEDLKSGYLKDWTCE